MLLFSWFTWVIRASLLLWKAVKWVIAMRSGSFVYVCETLKVLKLRSRTEIWVVGKFTSVTIRYRLLWQLSCWWSKIFVRFFVIRAQIFRMKSELLNHPLRPLVVQNEEILVVVQGWMIRKSNQKSFPYSFAPFWPFSTSLPDIWSCFWIVISATTLQLVHPCGRGHFFLPDNSHNSTVAKKICNDIFFYFWKNI